MCRTNRPSHSAAVHTVPMAIDLAQDAAQSTEASAYGEPLTTGYVADGALGAVTAQSYVRTRIKI